MLEKVITLSGVENGGTTFLLDLLRCHPRVYAPFEMGLLFATDRTADNLRAWAAHHQVQAKLLADGYGLTSEVLAEFAMTVNSWYAFYHKLFDRMVATDPKAAGRNILVDKKPDYAGFLEEIVYSKLPVSPALVLVRDPRAVYASWLKRHERRWPLEDFLAHYSRMMRGACRALELGRRIMLVRFEHLVVRTAATMQEVCNFLELEYDDRMADPAFSYARDPKTIYHYPHFGPGKQHRITSVDLRAVREWEDCLGLQMADRIEVAVLDAQLGWTLYRGEDGTRCLL
jgi:hypothetical protein